MKEILYTVAKNGNGELITARNANKGIQFFCSICNNQMLLRKSGKTEKNFKRPHFAHKTLTPNCTPETALHFSFKSLLAGILQRHLDGETPLKFSWHCKECDEIHTDNLLKEIKSVKVEYDLTIAQPDIALLDKNDLVFAVIEIVVTHKPENDVLQFYEDNDIILIQITLNSDIDIENIENKIAKPDLVNNCLNPKCPKCTRSLHKTVMTIADGFCWKCNSIMKVAYYKIAGSTIGPSRFKKEEIEFARSKGVIIKNRYSNTISESYLANTCNKCESFAGDFYLFDQYAAPASSGGIPSIDYEVGYHCEHCEEGEMVGENDY